MTPRQERFALEYLVDLNAAAAARRAGYSPRWARQIGSRLLKKPGVQAVIAAAQVKVQDDTGVRLAEVVKRLNQVVACRLKDLGTVEPNGRFVLDWPRIYKSGRMPLLKRVNQKAHLGLSGNFLQTEVELPDQVRAAELLLAHLGGFSPRAAEQTRAVRLVSATRLRATLGELWGWHNAGLDKWREMDRLRAADRAAAGAQ
ncbi:MAG: terminase small subunit [Candidatus Latescibacterota bacterium]|jgi:phage terminase small subunit